MNTLPIVYENENIYIIHKPSGLATQGGQGITHSVDTVLAKQVGKKIHLVHRLDKDTEGLLIVAKNSSSAHTWTDLLSEKEIQKEYYALCIGTFSKKEGIISEPITHKGETKEALTYYSVEKEFTHTIDSLPEKKIVHTSLVRLKLGTGRMHQIRIHLAKCGNPIAGDDKYGDFKINKALKKQYGVKKLHLAAIQLSIPSSYLETTNSVDNTKTTLRVFSIPIPDYIQKTCQNES